jgi:hypothetical protein
MSDVFGSYTFLPWLRQGIARSITAADGDQTVRLRATATVGLTLTGQAIGGGSIQGQVGRDVQLYGPGEVVGIESRAVIRTDPRPWITDFEPNYLAAIEFYEEDFPWRYTPAAPDGTRRRLRPWITLVVLKDTGDPATSEFLDDRVTANRPLPSITVKTFAPFPAADELWAWAHVHANRHLGANPDDLAVADLAAAVGRLAGTLATDPDAAYSRIVAPRRLEENAAYHAFLVPTFERGRLAGLGLGPDTSPFATASAWADYPGRPESLHLPYYYRWYFRTGGVGDFESLVRLLTWRTVDPRVGRRDIDVQAPGSNMPGILDPDLHGVLRLGGALRAPHSTLSPHDRAEYEKYENWAKAAYPHPFQRKLAQFINLADDFTRVPAPDARTSAGLASTDPDDVDPLITPPIYGEWQALKHRLLTDDSGAPLSPNDNWVHELNLDPRYRVSAGFGGDVVRKNQEDYMEAAWAQVGDVLAHNWKARVAQTWLNVNEAVHAKTIQVIADNPTHVLNLTAPIQPRVLIHGFAVRHTRRESMTPPVLTSAPWRRIVRPGGRLATQLGLAAGPHASSVLDAVNDGVITAAPPKGTPTGVGTVEDIADQTDQARWWPPEWLLNLLKRFPWLPLAFALLGLGLVILAVVAGGIAVLFLLALIALAIAVALSMARRQTSVADVIGTDLDHEQAIAALPPGPGFVFGDAANTGGRPNPTGSDNAAAQRFKGALAEWGHFITDAVAAGRPVPPVKLDLGEVATTVVDRIRPALTVPGRFSSTTVLAPHITAQISENFDEIRYYPRIDDPMYRPLKELSDEHFVPNLNLIGQDTVVALETNQEFIESYMVGVNSEFSRELLWREYPTDQRGSYFRQFWDVSGHFDPTATDADALRERLYDIPPIHRWPTRSNLGQHDNRQPDPGVERNEVVLAIRGQLLKKYPTTVIYAHAAEWQRTGGHVDPSKERQLAGLAPGEMERPPRSKVRTPVYQAKVDPDIYFFGFDVTADEARGGTGEHDTDPAGWFFVLKERPGEPRFGLDIARTAGESVVTVNDIAWSDAGTAPGANLSANALAVITLTPPSSAHDDLEKQPQHNDDVRVVGAPASSARWAYLLYQSPVMVAVHAAELLKPAAE